MKKLTSTSYALLSLLALRRWSGYELSQQMRRNVGEFWPRAERGIYEEAKNLLAHGLASAVAERNGQRTRTMYSITPKGRRALRGWLGEDASPPSFESEAVLRIAFAEHGSKEDAIKTLDSLRDQVAERRRVITDVGRDYLEGRGLYPQRVHIIALVSKFFADYYALLDSWAEWAKSEIEDWDDIAHPSNDSCALQALVQIAALRPAAGTR